MPNSNSLIKAGYNSVAWILNQVCSVRTKNIKTKNVFLTLALPLSLRALLWHEETEMI